MSWLDDIVGQVSANGNLQDLAAKVGLSPERLQQAIAAMAQAHASGGNPVGTAAEQTGLPQDKLQQVVSEMGGEAALGRIASMLAGEGDAGSVLGSLKGLF